MFGIPYTRQDWIDSEVAKAAAREPFGHRLHLVFGLLFMASVPGPMAALQVVGLLLVGLAVFRAYYIHRTWRSFGCHPLLWMIALWVAWQALATRWSPDPNNGWWEIHSCRWVWAMWLTWSIMPHRPLLLAALIAGFFAANLSQLAHGIGQALDIPAITFDRAPDRNSGWWQPVVGGSMLVAALGLHLPAAAMGSGRLRALGLLGSAITIAGIIATGSRGAWIAAAGLIALVLAIALVRALLSRDRRQVRAAAIAVLVLACAVAAMWLVAGASISRRLNEGRNEVARAIDQRDYSTWTGARILMLLVAWDELAAHPVRGVGTGGYQKWAESRPDREPGAIHRHAHNSYMHIAATTGLVGLALFLTVAAMGLWGAFRGMAGRLGSYASGPGFALIGLMLAGLTDVVHLNGQTSALFFVLLGLCIRPRPAESPPPAWNRSAWGRPFPR